MHKQMNTCDRRLNAGLRLLFCLLFFSFLPDAQAQYVRDQLSDTTSQQESGVDVPFTERLVPGGSFGLSFGNPWYVNLAPNLGYQFSERLVGGAGLTYSAFGGTAAGRSYRFERYGGSVFSRFRLFDAIFANAELELLNVPNEMSFTAERVWLVNPLLGLSYIMPLGKRGGIQASLLYNLNYQPNLSPYPSPLIWRIGFFL